MTDFQSISESLGLTSSARNYQGIFAHATLHPKCLHCLQQARWVLTTEPSDSIWRPNWSAGNYISPFKLLASLSWIKCSLPSWNCCHVLGNSCCDKVRGQLLRGEDWRVCGTRPSKARYPAAGTTASEGSPAHWEPQQPFWGLGQLEPVPGWGESGGIEKGWKPSASGICEAG